MHRAKFISVALVAIYPQTSFLILFLSTFLNRLSSTSLNLPSSIISIIHQAIPFINSLLHALRTQQSTPHRYSHLQYALYFRDTSFLPRTHSVILTLPTRRNHHCTLYLVPRTFLYVHSQYSQLLFSAHRHQFSPPYLRNILVSIVLIILIILIILIVVNIRRSPHIICLDSSYPPAFSPFKHVRYFLPQQSSSPLQRLTATRELLAIFIDLPSTSFTLSVNLVIASIKLSYFTCSLTFH